MNFKQAVTYAAAKKYLSGVGYFISKQDPFAVIDLDGCRDSETGEIADWAWKTIKTFNSYTEISTSGKGVHIWIYGTV
jgi:putative DNA primase/helicase